MLVGRVGDGEAAASTEFRHLEFVLLTHARGEFEDRVHSLGVRLELEHGRTEVHVEANELDARHV